MSNHVVGRWVRGLQVFKVDGGYVGMVGLVVLIASAGLGAAAPTYPTYATYPTSPPSTLTTKATHPRTHHAIADLSGRWRLTLEMEVGRATPLLELVEKDGKLTGTYTGRYGALPVEGTVEGRKVAFTVAMESTTLAFRGEIKDDGTLAGTATFGELGEVKWTAAREK